MKEPPPIIKASPKSSTKKPPNDLFDHFIDLIEERKPRQMTPSSSSSRRRRSRSPSPASRRLSYTRKRSRSPQSRYGHFRGRRRSRSTDGRKSHHDSKSPSGKSLDKKKSKRQSQSPKSSAHDQQKSKDNDESTRLKGSDKRQSRKRRDSKDSKVSDNRQNSRSPSTKLVKLTSQPDANKEKITEQKRKVGYTPERSPVMTAREQTPELRSLEHKKTRVMSPDKRPDSSSPDWGEKSKTPSQLLRPGSRGCSSSFDEDEYLYGDSSIGYEKDLPTFKNDKEDKFIKTKRLSSPQERRSHDSEDRAVSSIKRDVLELKSFEDVTEIRKPEKNRKRKDDCTNDVINKDCEGNRRQSYYKDDKKHRIYSHSPDDSSRRRRRSSSSDSNTDAKEPCVAKKKKHFNRWDKSPECESKSKDKSGLMGVDEIDSTVTKPHSKDQMKRSHFSDAAEREIDQPVQQEYRIQDDASVFYPNMSADKKGSFTGTITRTIFRSTFQPVVVEAQTEPPKTKPGFFLPRQIVISKKVDERPSNPDLESGLNVERRSDSNDSHNRSRSPSYSRTEDRYTGHSDIRMKSDDNRKRRDQSSKCARQVRSKSRSRTRSDRSNEERIISLSPIIHRSRDRLNYDEGVCANRSRHHSQSSSRESGQGGSSMSSSRDRTANKKIKRRSFSRDRKINVAGSSLQDDRSHSKDHRNTSQDTKGRQHDIQDGKYRSSLSPYGEGFSRDRLNRRSTSHDSWGSIRDKKYGRGTNRDHIVSSREQVDHRSDSHHRKKRRRLNSDQKSDRSISHEREKRKYHRSLNPRESSSPNCRQEDSRSSKSAIHCQKYSKSPKRSIKDSESPKITRKDSRGPKHSLRNSISPNRSREDIRNPKRSRKDNKSPNCSRNSHRGKSLDRMSAVEGEYDQKSRSFRISTYKSSERIRDVICSADCHGIDIHRDSKRDEKGGRAMGPRQSIGIGYRSYTSKSPSPIRSSNLSKTRSSHSQSRNCSDRSRKRSCSESRNLLDKSRKPFSLSHSPSRNLSERSRKPSSNSRSCSRNRSDRSRKLSSLSRSRSKNRSDKSGNPSSCSRSSSRNSSDKSRKPSFRVRSRSRKHSDKGRKSSSRSRSRSRNRSGEIRKLSSRSNSRSKNQSDKSKKRWQSSLSRSRSDRGSKRSHSRSRSRSQSNKSRIRSKCNSKSKIAEISKSHDNSKHRFTESPNKNSCKPDLPDVISSHKDKETPIKGKIQKGIKSEDESAKKIIQKIKRISSSSSSSSSGSSSSSSSSYSGRKKYHKKPAAVKIPFVKSKWDSSPKSSRWDPPDPKPRPPVNIPTYNQKPNKTLTQLETFLLELKQNKKKQTEQTTLSAKDKK
ncbi:serine/arginine repetitive matrix protein 2-like isoform X2 [Patella vulgata]|uniref:serine/arginine repetitive matrix protein 2-like isoform X2 n=1 Tax=Patella vulgata TaxID=6465 RepID=UPI0024A968BC|nr:serine/arginine repetitive matrix protein 2-like isoform X2 [Patella vulgata]